MTPNNLQPNSILNGKRPNTLLFRRGMRRGCQLSLFLFNIVLEVPGSAMRKEKERKASRLENTRTSRITDSQHDYLYRKSDGIYKEVL